MTVPRLIEITDYWSEVPPLNEAFAAFIGGLGTKRTSSSSPRRSNDEGNDDDLMKDLIAAGFQIPADILK